MTDRGKGILKRFQQETANHQMTVKHDDGLYRHIRFMDLKYSGYWFDLITVPGALIFQGDGETFAFRRIEDMFQFFRSGLRRDGSIEINPDYWAEKLTSDRDSVMTYAEDGFEQLVKEHVAECIRDGSAPRGIGKAIRKMLETGDITHEAGARDELENFEYGVTWQATCTCGTSEAFSDRHDSLGWRSAHITPENAQQEHRSSVERVDGFRFYDTWEWGLKDYDWWFLWALHGIVWGIAQYDASKAAAKTADAEAVA